MKPAFTGSIAATALLLGACASPNLPSLAQTLSETTAQNGRACIRTSDIRGYGVRSNNIINIDALHKYYIATVRPGCIDLATSAAVMFGGRFIEICGGGMDKIVTGENYCSIDKIYEFENREQAFAAFDKAVERREQLRDSQQQP